MNNLVLWECNNHDCSYKYKGEFMGKTHLPDTDCPECGYHDSMIETSCPTVDNVEF
jgi:hypothetical protein